MRSKPACTTEMYSRKAARTSEECSSSSFGCICTHPHSLGRQTAPTCCWPASRKFPPFHNFYVLTDQLDLWSTSEYSDNGSSRSGRSFPHLINHSFFALA